ncbi:winged helix-turn-helix transcriptional regulator [Candidatus Azambacteria bacterium]|nr:winged helix-turn-helix transcriptional regulator [Candidatus Azambacteria bacterium]MBI3684826.1 winged helix-turn-helix transcriptional regulator [Candidatus Azambacteria bacterium]
MLTKKQITEVKAGLGTNTAGFPLVFAALGDSRRFHIFRLLMKHHDICVTDVARVFGMSVSAASQQLRVLERVGLVLKTRMGQMVCYEINQENIIAKQLVALLKKSDK